MASVIQVIPRNTYEAAPKNVKNYCRTCLATDVRLFDLDQYSLSKSYEALVGHTCDEDDGLPDTVCYECASRLVKFRIFRKRSRRAHAVLQGLLEENGEVVFTTQITVPSVRNFNRRQHGLASSLVCCNLKPIIIEPKIEQTHFIIKVEQEDSNCNDSEISGADTETQRLGFKLKGESGSPDPSIDKQDYYVSFLPGSIQDDGSSNPDNSLQKPKIRVPKCENLTPKKDKVTNQEKVVPKRSRVRKNVVQVEEQTAEEGPKKMKRVRKLKSENGEEIVPRKKRTIKRNELKSDKLKAEGGKKRIRSRVRPGARQHTLYSAEYYNSFATVTVMTEEKQLECFSQRQYSERYKNAQYSCKDCYLAFATKTCFDAHRNRHDDPSEGSVVCKICKVRLKSERLLRKHITMNHRTKYACKKCPFFCTSGLSARTHESLHADEPHPCTVCGMVFKTFSSYRMHVNKRHPPLLGCPVCGHTYMGQGALNKHRSRTHTKVVYADSKKKCECGALFYSDEACSVHKSSHPKHADGGTGTIYCEFCEDNYPDLEMALEHRKLHKQEITILPKDWTCEQCGWVLRSKGDYTKHFRFSHPGVVCTKYVSQSSGRGVMCELCGKVYPSTSHYNNHMKSHHQGPTDYKCGICNKYLATSHILHEHSRTHTKEKPYQCTICNRRFAHRSNFTRHGAVHTDETPFGCDICGKKFKYRNHVKHHIQYVHLKKPWPKRNRSKRTQKTV